MRCVSRLYKYFLIVAEMRLFLFGWCKRMELSEIMRHSQEAIVGQLLTNHLQATAKAAAQA